MTQCDDGLSTGPIERSSLQLWKLMREHGRIKTDGGVFPLSEAV